jgi:Tol biopolymer transport system component
LDSRRELGRLRLWEPELSLAHRGQRYSQPKRVEIAGLGANWPSTAFSQDRLAFARVTFDTDIYRFTAGHRPRSVAASTFPEFEARWSPDGRRIAFTSLRSGERNEIWVAEADGSGVRQFTHGPGPTGSPWWSPDGRRIAFDSITNDHSHIWLIDADGGTPHQLTTDAGDQTVPTWSHDGQWIYFSADHGTGRDIWRVPATGGPSQRVTREGSGLFACESPDGKSLLYQPNDADSPLLALPLSGGPPRQLVACVKPSASATGPQGVYYVACDSSPDPALHVRDPKTGQDRLLGRLERYENNPIVLPLGLAVSPDGMSVLYLRHMSDTSDLMLIENFR